MERSFITKLRNIALYAALTIELLLMVYERSVLPLSSPKQIFRISFVLSVIALLLTKYSLKQWIVIVIVCAISVVSYKITGNNDLLRFSVFVIACKDVDLKAMLRYIFVMTTAGALLIVAMSVTGFAGDIRLIDDFGREAGSEVRYTFGFGHPNTLMSVVFSIEVLFVYLIRDYKRAVRNGIMVAMLALNVILYFFTGSRTGVALTVFTIVLAFAVYEIKFLQESAFLYGFGIAVIGACVAFSVWAARISKYARKKKYPFYYKLDKILTGRIQSLYYDTKPHKGSLKTWSLFGDEFSGNSFFDMGWVRLFYWYGIIPAILILLVIVYFIYRLYHRRDYATMIMVISISVFTLVEASFVSSFIGRNYLLPIAGVYLFSESLSERNRADKS
ncbi:hypothetical protein [Butyrivibrio sp. XPD2002]|uniref:hypothetical protein n=1 Tax=Butyrivibrio sp. XPD2002 TaxID=1280665 RepID=UPI00041B1109|nr:hypothetical protein [Butyrivibrio sp. XPD2002]